MKKHGKKQAKQIANKLLEISHEGTTNSFQNQTNTSSRWARSLALHLSSIVAMAGKWSTASGKRLMMPRSMIDEPLAEPSGKKARGSDNALVSPRPALAPAQAPTGKQNLAVFRCEDCNGTAFWGHGNGYDDGKGGKTYRCGDSKCRKILKFLPPEEVQKRKDACGCVSCLTEVFIKQGMGKEEARAEAKAALEALGS